MCQVQVGNVQLEGLQGEPKGRSVLTDSPISYFLQLYGAIPRVVGWDVVSITRPSCNFLQI